MARLAAFGGLGRLDSLTVDDGSVTVVIVHEVRDEGLPALVAKFFPHSWRVLQTETWSPICDGIMRGEVDIAAHGAPGSGVGMALLAPARNGSRLKCEATVEFKVPLVGGKFENIMGRSLAHQFAVIERFTSDWIAKNT